MFRTLFSGSSSPDVDFVQQIAFQDYVDAVMDAERRLQRVEEQIFSLLPEWNRRPVVDALQAMRGIALINAVVLVTEVGDFTRFSNRPNESDH